MDKPEGEMFLTENIREYHSKRGEGSQSIHPIVSIKGFTKREMIAADAVKIKHRKSRGTEFIIENMKWSKTADPVKNQKLTLAISVYNKHAAFYSLIGDDFYESETKFGWCDYEILKPFEYIRYHLAFREENSEQYSIYKECGVRSRGMYKFFVLGHYIVSPIYISVAAIIACPQVYKLLDDDCLEYAKTTYRLFTHLTNTEMNSEEETHFKSLTITNFWEIFPRSVPGVKHAVLAYYQQINYNYVIDKIVTAVVMLVFLYIARMFGIR